MNSGAATKKVIVEFPDDLLKQTEAAAAKLCTYRSKLIRRAVEEFLNCEARQELEQSLAAGYAANADFDRRIARDFAYVDSENI